jgi:protein involved in polysaccharide export with SLBB domain
MSFRFVRLLALVVSASALPSPAAAQRRPTPAQMEQLTRDPSALQRLQRELQSSGLTPAQLRQRLRAEGYSENLLDPYLSSGPVDSTMSISGDVFAAVQALGIIDSAGVDSLRTRRGPDRQQNDSTLVRSVMTALQDSATAEAIRELLRNRSSGSDSGFSVFGNDVFGRETSQFDPVMSGPVGSDYRLGPGDQLVLILTGQTEASYQLTVTREGFIVIPSVGQLSVANLTMAQLEGLLTSRLGRVYSGIRSGGGGSTQFSISMARLGTVQVSVVGDVRTPGSYRISRIGNVLTALYAAGGPSDVGSMRVVELKRGARLVGRFDLYDYLLSGNVGSDLRPENGDVVFVPPRGRQVRMSGAVLRPATYELREGETLQDLFRMAGGFRPSADRRRVQIERILPATARGATGSDRTAIEISSPLLANGFGPPLPLEAGDIVRVRNVPRHVANRIVVSGNVWSGGQIALAPGMKLSDALRTAGGIKPDTYLESVQITRLLPDSTRTMLRTALVDTAGRPVHDIVLEDADEIRVFSSTEFRPQRYVVVNGAVQRSGRVPFRDGMTLRDVVMLAGGLTEGALLTEALVARMPETRASGATANTMRVPLDSGFIFEKNGGDHYAGPPGVPTQMGRAPEFTLRAYDHVLILRQPEWTLLRSAVIAGEVRFPGRYTLESKNERLSDLIRRAGGLTSTGYAGGVVFIRTRDARRFRSDTGDVEIRIDSLGRLVSDTRDSTGRIGVDLPEVLRNAKHPDNILLIEGDSVFIPALERVVHVAGAVNSATTVAHRSGFNIDDYIRAAGGRSPRGDTKHAYVVQPNGKLQSRESWLWFIRATPVPEPGSTVFVPLKLPRQGPDYATILAATTSVVSSIITLIVVLK